MRILPALCLGAALMGLNACQSFDEVGDIDGTRTVADMAVPFINTKVTLQDAVDKYGYLVEELQVNADGSLALHYETEQKSIAGPVWTIPDFPMPTNGSSTNLSLPAVNGSTINSISLRQGTLSFQLRAVSTRNVRVTIVLPQLTKGGSPFTQEVELVFNGNSNLQANTAPLSLEGYELVCPGGKMTINYNAVNTNGEKVNLQSCVGQTQGWQYHQIGVALQQQNLTSLRDTIEIEVVSDRVKTDIHFADPTMDILFTNNMGFKLSGYIQQLKVITDAGQSVNLITNDDQRYIEIPAAMDANNPGTAVWSLNKDNSAIEDVLSNKPIKLYYEIVPTIEAGSGVMPLVPMFSAKGELGLPIEGFANFIQVQETAPVDLSLLKKVDMAEITLETENEFPLGGSGQIVFLDASQNPIDSLFTSVTNVLIAANTDDQGNLVTAGKNVNTGTMDRNRIVRLLNSKFVRFSANMATGPQASKNVRFKNSQGIKVVLRARTRLR
jgi:hypothetical protein